MHINLLLFATLKDKIGHATLSMELTEMATVSELRRSLSDRFPAAGPHIAAAVAAVNEDFAQPETTLSEGDNVALFPPVSGGQGDPKHPEVFLLPHEPINHDKIVAAITTPSTGAVCLFSGLVRGTTNRTGHQKETARLEYEAYAPMAISKMRQVAAEIRARWPLVQGIAIAQRLGLLTVGDNTILIACSSGHRDEGCFEAARYGIDRLKEIVPVWKKEIGPEGDSWVEGSYVPSSADRADSL